MTRWPTVTLADLTDSADAIVGGPFGSELTTKDYQPAPGVPVIRGTNLGSNGEPFLDDGFVFVSDTKARSLSRNTARPGDIIFTQRGTVGQVNLIPATARYPTYIVSQSQMRLRPHPARVDPRFLVRYYRSSRGSAYLAKRTLVTGVPHINLGILKEFPVPLPPLEEQRRIADILDRADALRAKRRGTLGLLDDLTQSIFVDLFGDPEAERHRWPVVRLETLISNGPQNGLYKPASEYGEGTRILRIDGFYDGAVTDLTTLRRVRVSDGEQRTYGLRERDIVINRVNSREYLGKSAIIPQLDEPVVFESNMMRLTFDVTRVLPEFLIRLLQTSFVRRQVLRAAKDAINQSSINQQDVRSLEVILPPLDLQRSFVRRLEAVRVAERSAHRSLAEMDALFASLQDRAFRGEL